MREKDFVRSATIDVRVVIYASDKAGIEFVIFAASLRR